jgi:hypothetical protein
MSYVPVKIAAAAALMAGAAWVGSIRDANAAGVEFGYLECSLILDTGNVVVSKQTYSCTFDPADDAKSNEAYTATTDKIGLDLSKTNEEKLRWLVLAAGDPDHSGALAGDYGGVSADASIGLGAGAMVLVGGLEDTFTLQPVSMSTQQGVGLSIAVESMDLVYTGPKS